MLRVDAHTNRVLDTESEDIELVGVGHTFSLKKLIHFAVKSDTRVLLPHFDASTQTVNPLLTN